MFKNKHLQVKVMKDEEILKTQLPPKYLVVIHKDQVRYIGQTILAVMVTRKVVNTACELVLIRAGRG